MATLAELWAGPHLKQEHATYFWQRMQDSGALTSGAGRPFYAEFDAFLAMARSVPELIRACFGVEEMPPKDVRDWFDRLDTDEQRRRATFTTQLEPMYRAFQNLPLSIGRTAISNGAGGAGVQVLVVDRFGVSPVTDAVSAAQSDGRPLYDDVVAYLEQVSNLIAAAHKIAAEVHGSQSLTAPI